MRTFAAERRPNATLLDEETNDLTLGQLLDMVEHSRQAIIEDAAETILLRGVMI